MSRTPNGNVGSEVAISSNNNVDLAQLFQTWAFCEWHCENLSSAGVLFDHALRLTSTTYNKEEGLRHKSFLLYSIASLEYYAEEYHLAQHFIGLCLKEDCMPGGNGKVWELWSKVASEMGNPILSQQCKKEARRIEDEESKRDHTAPNIISLRQGPNMKPLMNRAPWQHKLFTRASTLDFDVKDINDHTVGKNFLGRITFPVKHGKMIGVDI